MGQVMATILGYQDRLEDIECSNINQAYWIGYYTNAKKPKSPSTIIAERKRKKQRSKSVTVPDIDKFKERMERLNRGGE